MFGNKRGQISVEYLIVVGFVMFIIIGILGVAFIYSSTIQDQIKLSQLTSFANKVVSNSESVYYSGEPSRVTINAYLPGDVESLELTSGEIIFNISTNTGINIISFSSNVGLSGTISTNKGLKRLKLIAQEDNVLVSET